MRHRALHNEAQSLTIDDKVSGRPYTISPITTHTIQTGVAIGKPFGSNSKIQNIYLL